MKDYAIIRQLAGFTQMEAAVRAGVCIGTCRNFERHGPSAVPELTKQESLVELYRKFECGTVKPMHRIKL